MKVEERKKLMKRGAKLTQQIKAMTAELDAIKEKFRDEGRRYAKRGFEYGDYTVKISSKDHTSIDPRELEALLKSMRKSKYFFDLITVHIEKTRSKLGLAIAETITDHCISEYAVVSFTKTK